MKSVSDVLSDDEIFKIEMSMFPRYQLIFQSYSPMMAIDQPFDINEDSELDKKLFKISWDHYFKIHVNLVDLMNRFKIEKTSDNIRTILEKSKNQLMNDCWYWLVYKKEEIKKLENCWYLEADWYKERIERYDLILKNYEKNNL